MRNVSQLTPSTHVVSPLFVPPTAVPFHVNGSEFGAMFPLVGPAARVRTADIRHARLSAKSAINRVQRCLVIEALLLADVNSQRAAVAAPLLGRPRS
jgi:hypothetical protein